MAEKHKQVIPTTSGPAANLEATVNRLETEIQQQRGRVEEVSKCIDWAIELIEKPSPRFVSTSGYLTGEQIGKILMSIKEAKAALKGLGGADDN